MEGFATLISTLFRDLDVPKRWVAIVTVFGLIVVGLYGLELMTGYSYYRSMEKKIELLKTMQEIHENGIANNPDLLPVYQSTIRELDQRPISPIQLPSIVLRDPIALAKGASAALLLAIVAIVGAFGAFGQKTGMNFAVAATVMVVALLFGWIGAIIPTIGSPWVNIVGYPVLQIAALLILSRRQSRRKKA